LMKMGAGRAFDFESRGIWGENSAGYLSNVDRAGRSGG
jgi:hypothetical protein